MDTEYSIKMLNIEKILKYTIIVLCFISLTYQTVRQMQSFLRHSTDIDIHIKDTERSKFPSISVCETYAYQFDEAERMIAENETFGQY